jgi:hypothetical protein
LAHNARTPVPSFLSTQPDTVALMDAIQWAVIGTRVGTLTEFVRFWERLYTGYNENFYRENIGQPLTPERIALWFEWKNGTPLSANKSQTIRRYSSDEERIAYDADLGTLTDFLNRPGGAVWRIFWLHLQHPSHFPIYDQHVHRAMAFLLKLPTFEIPVHDPAKVCIYLADYRPFFRRFCDCEHRQVDRALWAFGRFLKSEYGPILTAPIQ